MVNNFIVIHPLPWLPVTYMVINYEATLRILFCTHFEDFMGTMSRVTWVNGSLRVHLGGGFKYFLCSPLLGEDSHFDSYFFQWVGSTTNQLLQQGSIGKEALLSTSVSRANELSFC